MQTGVVNGAHSPLPLLDLYFPAKHPLHLPLIISNPGLQRHEGVVGSLLAKHLLVLYTQA